jgi:hypothetical protein
MSFVIEDAIIKSGHLVQGNKLKFDNHRLYVMSLRVTGNWFPTFRPGIKHSKIKAAR